MVQVLNQFIKRLQSSILRSIRHCHPTSLQDAVALARDFESAKQKANHTQAINLAINGTSDIDAKITQLTDTHSNRTVSNSNNLGDLISATVTTARNLDTSPVQTNSRPFQLIPRGPAQSRPTPTGYLNQASYLGLIEDQGFDKSTPVEGGNIERISQPSKQTKSNIPPATITKDTTLAAIFPFDIDNLNTHSLFNGAAINQYKPIMNLYTDARVGGIDIKLILDSGSASSIFTKQFMDQLALVENNWLSKANATLNWNTQELQFTFNGQHAQVPVMCRHFKTQHTKEPLIEFEDTSMPPTIETY
ncbi:hypothetical protein G9A89_016906 [Geosiphon pyriformis]|nr:hypothetical protein G9A89_016906 [Geosiphon pyriformis]